MSGEKALRWRQSPCELHGSFATRHWPLERRAAATSSRARQPFRAPCPPPWGRVRRSRVRCHKARLRDFEFAAFFHLTNEQAPESLYTLTGRMPASTRLGRSSTRGDSARLSNNGLTHIRTTACRSADVDLPKAGRSARSASPAARRSANSRTPPTVGLYLLEGASPISISRHVEEGFLDNYEIHGFWKCDPVLDCIDRRPHDRRCVAARPPPLAAASCELLHEWGFSYNMGGPLWCRKQDRRRPVPPRRPTPQLPIHRCCASGWTCCAARARWRSLPPMNSGQIDDDATSRSCCRHFLQPSGGGAFGTVPPRSADVTIRVCRGPGKQGDRARDGNFGPDRERTRVQSVQALRRHQHTRRRPAC